MNPPTTQPPTEQDLPPLRIHHFMLWMAGSAALFSLYMWRFPALAQLRLLLTLSLSLEVLSSAIGLSCCFLGIYWQLQGRKFFCEVGHWLLIFVGWACLEAIARQCVGYSISIPLSSTSRTLLSILAWESRIHVILQIAICMYIAIYVADTQRWKQFCVSLAACKLLYQIWYLMKLLTDYLWSAVAGESEIAGIVAIYGFSLLWSILWIRAVYEDYRTGVPRHWSHWVGVITWLMMTLGVVLLDVFKEEMLLDMFGG